MNFKQIRDGLLLRAVVALMQMLGCAQQNSDASAVNSEPAMRDGSHDFDPLIGAWKEHTEVRQHPLTGSDTWIQLKGVDVNRKIWGGRAVLAEYEGDSDARHIESVMLYTYNPQTTQWSVYFASSSDGRVTPPNAGEFKNRQGEFYAQDTLNGKLRYNRYIWSKLTTNSPRFEESWSDDGRKTWEVDTILRT